MTRSIFVAVAVVIAMSVNNASQCSAQEFLEAQPANTESPIVDSSGVDITDHVKLFDLVEQPKESANSAESMATTKKPSTAELRQARAMYRSQQREARIQRNLWMGYEPLRPNWNATPMTSSPYTARTIYIPVYINRR